MFMRGVVLLVAGLLTTCRQHETSIKLVHAIFRHGPRTPADTYPNDPYLNFTFAPVGWGQLTNNGKLAQYRQGQFLRERYNGLLGDMYSPGVIIAQSTEVDRTQMSAQLELAGMWPPAPAQKWHPELNWQPIPVHSQPLDHDDLLLVRIPCPRYHKELENVTQSLEVQNELERLGASALYQELSNITGLHIATPDDVQSLYSTLKAEEEYGLTLPEWTTEYYPDRLTPLTAFSFRLNAYNKELQRIKGGPLLKKIIRDSQNKIEGRPNARFYIYAGHDSTISNFLMTLDVWDTQVPTYGILVLVELHEETVSGQYGIKIYLRNSTSHEPYPLTLPGCHHFCHIDQFLNLTHKAVPYDIKEHCRLYDSNYVPPTLPPP